MGFYRFVCSFLCFRFIALFTFSLFSRIFDMNTSKINIYAILYFDIFIYISDYIIIIII